MPPNADNPSRSLMLWSILIALVLLAVIVPFAWVGKGARPAAVDESVAARIQPVAGFELKLAAKVAAGPRTAESIYTAVCGACHGTGVGGAPKRGDKAAWAPRLKGGIDALLKSAIAGKGAMPPKGGAADLSEAELKSVIELLSH